MYQCILYVLMIYKKYNELFDCDEPLFTWMKCSLNYETLMCDYDLDEMLELWG